MVKTGKTERKKSPIISEKKIIGRQVLVDLPDLGLFEADAKMDTGAFTSSLHCKDIEAISDKNKKLIRFSIFDENKNCLKKVTCLLHSEKTIKSSNGQKEKRFVIITTLQMGGETFETEFTLTDRSEMRNQILIGRKALTGRFLVDVSKTDKRSKS